jgi:heme exporter protein A
LTTSDLRLIARDLTCLRGGRLVYEGLSFEVGAGTALVLTGPNGSGKSSLLRQIAGLLDLAEGTLLLKGGDGERSIAEQSHYVGHLDALKPSMSVIETLRFQVSYLEGDAGLIDPALDAVALGPLADLPVAYLSAGQKRRLALARLAAVPRPIWLLDEPSVALDKASVERLQNLMNTHLRGGGIIVAATHLDLGLERAQELRLGQRVSA